MLNGQIKSPDRFLQKFFVGDFPRSLPAKIFHITLLCISVGVRDQFFT